MPNSNPSSSYHRPQNNHRWTSANTGRVPKPRGNIPQNRRVNTMHRFPVSGRASGISGFSLNEMIHSGDDTLGPYASVDFDESVDVSAFDVSGNGFQNVVTNLVNMGVANLKYSVDPIVQPLHIISRKKLREAIINGNNSLFNFLKRPDRTPIMSSTNQTGQGYGEYLIKKYSGDVFTIIQKNANTSLNPNRDNNYYNCKDAAVDTSVVTTMAILDDKIQNFGPSKMTQLIEQVKWIGNELRSTSEDIMRLENLIIQKMESIDRIQGRVGFINSLKPNEHLPELINAFTQYVTKSYESCAIEDDFKQLVECYKKWMILKDIVSFQKCVDGGNSNQDCQQKVNNEPGCSICLTESVSHAIVPCGHTYCSNCIKKQSLTCYICRGPVRDRIKIFFT